MKTLQSHYNKIFSEKYRALGFVKYKTAFACITGDILKTFALKRYNGNRDCTITIGISSVYHSYLPPLDSESYTICSFFPSFIPFSYNPKSDESMEACVNSLSEAVDTYLLPLFDACCDCQSTFSALLKAEEFMNEMRQEMLVKMQWPDMAKPWQTNSLYDDRKYYMALKLENWDYARRYLELWIDTKNKTLEWYGLKPEDYSYHIIRTKESRDLFVEQLNRLNSGDYAYFSRQLDNNKQAFLAEIAQKYPKLLQQ